MLDLIVKTSRAVEARDITRDVVDLVKGKEGAAVHVYTPHTTCGIMVNEHADPDVIRDILEGLERMAPQSYPYRHREGNSHAHLRAAIVGGSVTIPFSMGRMMLGTWQGIFFIDFDGPRERRILVTLL
jgi:secondary thiamine-phosphate synthase enzyme